VPSYDSLRTVLAQIHSSLDLPQTLDAIALGVATGTHFTTAAVTIVLPDGSYQVVAVEGSDKARDALLGTIEPASTWERLYEAATPVGQLLFVDHRHDVLDESMTTWIPDLPRTQDPSLWHPDDVLFAPLVDSAGRRVGALGVDVPIDGRRPGLEDLVELELYANQAALAIEHAHSFAAAQQNAVLRERERLAEDMHDFVAQRLYAAAVDLDRARTAADRDDTVAFVEQALTGIDDATRQLRSAIRGDIETVDPTDIGATVAEIADRARTTLGFTPSVRWIGGRTDIPSAIAHDLVAVVTEALSNAAKHAAATTVTIAITVTDTAISASIRDDGIGLTAVTGRGNSGLDTMRRRAERHHGTCQYLPGTPQGTTVHWSVPRP
jgi:signal transduction histidine kinase